MFKTIAVYLLTSTQVWAYTGVCQVDLSVLFERSGNLIKPLIYSENNVYNIRPLSTKEIKEQSVAIKALNVKSPHYLIRPSLGLMLCGYHESKPIAGRLTNPYLKCDYVGDTFELNITSSRFIHHRKGDSIDTLDDLQMLGKAPAFTEFGTCIGN